MINTSLQNQHVSILLYNSNNYSWNWSPDYFRSQHINLIYYTVVAVQWF